MYTKAFLKSDHNENIPAVGKKDFTQTKFIYISDLYANQELIDSKVLNYKLLGKNLSQLFVIEFNNKKILIDGHHTVIAKKLNGNKRVKCKYLKIN